MTIDHRISTLVTDRPKPFHQKRILTPDTCKLPRLVVSEVYPYHGTLQFEAAEYDRSCTIMTGQGTTSYASIQTSFVLSCIHGAIESCNIKIRVGYYLAGIWIGIKRIEVSSRIYIRYLYRGYYPSLQKWAFHNWKFSKMLNVSYK